MTDPVETKPVETRPVRLNSRNADGVYEPFTAREAPQEELFRGRFGSRWQVLSQFGGGSHVGVILEELPPGMQSNRVHSPMLEEEHVFVLDGTMTVRLGGKSVRARQATMSACARLGRGLPPLGQDGLLGKRRRLAQEVAQRKKAGLIAQPGPPHLSAYRRHIICCRDKSAIASLIRSFSRFQSATLPASGRGRDVSFRIALSIVACLVRSARM